MPKVFSDDYYTVVAESKEQAVQFFIDQELTDEEGIEYIEEVDPDKKTMLFPVDELPEEYHDEEKYPRENWCGYYEGVSISL